MPEPSDIVLRPLQAADIPTVSEFERDIALVSFPDDPVTDLAFYEKKLRAAMADARAVALVAEKRGRVVGWAWLAERENFTTKERYGDLRSFYVAKGERGGGVAFALMRACLDEAKRRDLKRLAGRTAATNEAMQALYDLYGFAAKHVVYELSMGEEGARNPRPVKSFARSGRSRRRDSRAP
jgi:GNAT superfamily N-acetyltransferase